MLSSPAGEYDIDAEQVRIPGIVQFDAADGYRLMARNVTVDLPSRTLHGDGRVEGSIPAGTFEADDLRVDLAERRLTLRGNAFLRIVPGRLQMPGGE